mgnify:CR=1 FL=1
MSNCNKDYTDFLENGKFHSYIYSKSIINVDKKCNVRQYLPFSVFGL